MPLHKEDSIKLKTPLGTSEVQLLLGDITQLPQDEGVDIIMVSSFQGDYSVASAGTLISALYRKLQIDVGDLARDKEMDMRLNFHCWVSKPLPNYTPYRRLVCFERGRKAESGTTAQQISVLFRAMTPIFNNEDTSVITPLLATGNQGQSRVAVLRAMVDGACHWIKAGLPLRCLKLVLYALNPQQLCAKDQEAVILFKKLKKVWESSDLKQSEEDQRNDVFISHSNHDNHWVDIIYKQLYEIRPSLKVVKKHIEFSVDQVWQENIFHVMMQSKRIIIILSPAYVQDPECLEQFNMALCVNRLSSHHQICPMYVETVPSLPSYMQLMQYVECRERKEGEKSHALIKIACKNILGKDLKSGQNPVTAETTDVPVTDVVYDVFISYAHRNPAPAETLMKYFQEMDRDLTVFFDRSELTTGSLWQQTLYNSMDNARCVVALLSPAYVQSDVCQEEYNIALNRALAGKKVSLIPICIEAMDTIPTAFSHVLILDAFSADQNGVLRQVSEDVVQLVKWAETGESIVKPSLLVQPSQAQEDYRKEEFEKYFQRDDKSVVFKDSVHKNGPNPRQEITPKDQTQCDVVFSMSHDSVRLAFILTELINRVSPDSKCKFISENNKERLSLLDQARLVVVIVSDGYVQSSQLLEELHLSLCRQRREKSSPMVYLIQAMHLNTNPFYVHLLDYKVSMMDKLWTELVKDLSKSKTGKFISKDANSNADQMFVITRNGIKGSYSCSLPERLALSKASLEITDILENRSHLTVSRNIVNMAALRTASSSRDQTVPLQECLKFLKAQQTANSPAEQKKGECESNVLVKDSQISTEDNEGKSLSGENRKMDKTVTADSVWRLQNEEEIIQSDGNSETVSNHELFDYQAPKLGKRYYKRSAFCTVL